MYKFYRALTYRNYRLFFIGQSVSLTGTWIQQVALQWVVYRMTDSPLLLGLTGFLGQIPALLVSPLAGVMLDHNNQIRILQYTQILALLQAVTLAFLALSGNLAVWQILLLSFFLGLVNAFDVPARQSLVKHLVEKHDDIGNAIALNSSLVNLARLAGSSLAGILLNAFNEGICFLINAVTFIAPIVALNLMKFSKKHWTESSMSILESLKDGMKYVRDHSTVRALMTLVAVLSLAGVSYLILMPVFARDIFHGGPSALGFLVGASGTGALIGALYLAQRESVQGLGKVIVFSGVIFGGGLILFSLTRTLGTGLFLMAVTGYGMMVQLAGCNTAIQVLIDDKRRGRVMGLYTMCFMGMVPLGSLLLGFLAGKIGASYTILISGTVCLLASGLFARQLPLLRKSAKVSLQLNGTAWMQKNL